MNCNLAPPSLSTTAIYYGIPTILVGGAVASSVNAAQKFSQTFLGSNDLKSRFENLSKSDNYKPLKETVISFFGTDPLSARVSNLSQAFISSAMTLSFLYVCGQMGFFDHFLNDESLIYY